MPRCIIVLGIPRSGSSCIAGILHQLGVDMGTGHFQSKDKFNQRGYFEDLRWRMTTQKVTGRGYGLKAAGIKSIPKGIRRQYRKLASECSTNPLWGVKDPWFCFVPGRAAWNQIRAVGTDVRLVAVHRSLESSRRSVAKHLRASYHNNGSAARIVKTWKAAMDERIAEFDGRVLEVRYEYVVAQPSVYVNTLWAFASQELDIQSKANFDAIAKWVTPKLKHF